MARLLVMGEFSQSRMHSQGDLLGRLVDAGHRVAIATSAASTGVASIDANRSIRCRQVAMPAESTGRRCDLEAIWQLHRRLRQESPQFFCAYTVRHLVYGMLAGWLADRPMRCVLLTGLKTAPSAPEDTRRYLLQRGASMLYRLSQNREDSVVFHNRDEAYVFCARRLVDHPRQVIMIDARGVDTEAFRPVELPDGARFLYAGPLGTSQGIVEYVQAARRIGRHHRDVQFQIVGWPEYGDDGVDRRQLQSWIGGDAVEYLGRPDDIVAAIANASVVVSPPHRPGAPGVALEAMAMGRPVVTTDVDGCRQAVDYGANGYCVEPGDVEGLARAMTHFVGEPEPRRTMGACSRQKAVDRFDIDDVAIGLMEAMELTFQRVPPPLPSDVGG